MRRNQTTIFLILTMLLGSWSSQAQSGAAIYTNPVIGNPARVEREIPDPFVLKWNGEYYLYTSGNPITAYHSLDLVNWTPIGPVLAASEQPLAWNQADVWAPEVVYRNGKFYLYYTATLRSADWRIGEMARRIGVAVSDSPRGPFVDSGRPVTPGWGIDGHVFQDPDTGAEYLFYSYLYEPRLPGAGIVVDRLTGRDSVAGRPAHVTLGSEAWEDKDGNPHNGSLRYTNEAPTVLKRHGQYYMMYSGGSWDLPTYSLAYATADSVLQGGLDGPGWRKVGPPILRHTTLVDAPGHNSLVKAPNNVDDICVYHARTVPFLDPWNRLPFVDRLYWNHDRMFMQPPTRAELPPPDRPLWADNFNRADGALGEAWQAVTGEWRIVGNQLEQGRPRPGPALLLPKVERLTNYVFEVNLKSPQANRTVNATYGAAAYYSDPQNHIDVWLDRERKVLVTAGILNGMAIPEQTTELPTGFRFDVYHQIIVTKNANQFRFALDGINAQTRTFDVLPGAGTVALQTLNTQATFDGVALTPFFEDAFAGPAVTWEVKQGTWLAEEGALHQVAGGAARALALKGDAAENYEFTASLRGRDNESVTAQAGIVAAATASDELVLAGFDRNIWPLARFHLQHSVQGQVKDAFSVELPRGFIYDQFHTIRVVKQGSGFTFFLDGREIAAARYQIGAARPGLFTAGVRAAFDDCALKQTVVPQNLLLNGSFETEQWGPAAASNPWRLSGRARGNYCCAHTGLWRLIVPEGAGEAQQTVTLAPGRYKLIAWTSVADGAEAEVSVKSASGPVQRVAVRGEPWTRTSLEFEVPTQAEIVITFAARLKAGASGTAAADDFYLLKL